VRGETLLLPASGMLALKYVLGMTKKTQRSTLGANKVVCLLNCVLSSIADNCRTAAGELEWLLLDHGSIQTTGRYLGTKRTWCMGVMTPGLSQAQMSNLLTRSY
jgi:hypothetical protein